MTLKIAYETTKKRLSAAGVENAAFEAACILESRVGLRHGDLLLQGGREIDFSPIETDIRRREAGEPLQYILGEWEFMGLRFRVGPGVLIPRADTEPLAETGIDFLRSLPQGSAPRALDLCTGSGCVAISVAHFVPGCHVFAIDRSDAAIGFASENAARLQVSAQVTVLRGNMLDGSCERSLPHGMDLILCNPPYIRREEIAGLDASVRFEPSLALDGGSDGLDFYRAAKLWFPMLRPGGMAAFETGYDQARAVAELFGQFALSRITIRKDYHGVERVVTGIVK